MSRREVFLYDQRWLMNWIADSSLIAHCHRTNDLAHSDTEDISERRPSVLPPAFTTSCRQSSHSPDCRETAVTASIFDYNPSKLTAFGVDLDHKQSFFNQTNVSCFICGSKHPNWEYDP
jgi:hypothetical protein